jgi:hypothetical protein
VVVAGRLVAALAAALAEALGGRLVLAGAGHWEGCRHSCG